MIYIQLRDFALCDKSSKAPFDDTEENVLRLWACGRGLMYLDRHKRLGNTLTYLLTYLLTYRIHCAVHSHKTVVL